MGNAVGACTTTAPRNDSNGSQATSAKAVPQEKSTINVLQSLKAGGPLGETLKEGSDSTIVAAKAEPSVVHSADAGASSERDIVPLDSEITPQKKNVDETAKTEAGANCEISKTTSCAIEITKDAAPTAAASADDVALPLECQVKYILFDCIQIGNPILSIYDRNPISPVECFD